MGFYRKICKSLDQILFGVKRLGLKSVKLTRYKSWNISEVLQQLQSNHLSLNSVMGKWKEKKSFITYQI